MRFLRFLFMAMCLCVVPQLLHAQVTVRNGMSYVGAYSGASTYAKGDTVSSSGIYYVSLVGSNVGNTPASSPTQWGALGSSGTSITALTGDVAATGPGSAAATLATVNSSSGTCGDATHVCQVTTNPKGLTTSQTQVPISGGGGGSCPLQDATNICITQAPYYASTAGGTTTTTAGGFTGTTGPVVSCSTFLANNGVLIVGAGTSGTNYIGTVVSCTGTTLVVTPATSTLVSSGVVQHDETAAFLAAFTALNPTGGTIWVPNGTYLVNGPLQDTSGANAILPMPKIANYSTSLTGIRIAGLGNQAYAGPVIQTALNTSGANFIGGFDSAGGGGFPNFTNVILQLQGLTILGPSSGSETLVNGTWLLGLQTTAVNVVTVNGAPGSGNGVLFPTVSNNVHLSADDLAVSGFATCVRAGEHTNIGSLYLVGCVNGLVPDASPTGGFPTTTNGVSVAHMWCGPTSNPVTNCVASGANKTAIDIGVLDWEDNGTGSDVVVKDSGNLLSGKINYNRVFQTCPTALEITGGGNLSFSDLKCGTPGTSGYALTSNGPGAPPSWQSSPGITSLTGDVAASGPGSATATLAASGVTAGSYTSANIAVDAKGRITSATNGTGGSGGGALTNITSSVTVSGCTVTGNQCIVGTAVATVTFSSIPGTYSNLKLLVTGRSTTSDLGCYLQFNGDTGANYNQTYSIGAATVANNSTPGVAKALLFFISSSAANTGVASSSETTIHNYAGTAWFKNATSLGFRSDLSGSIFNTYTMTSGLSWNNTAAITSMTIGENTGAGSFAVGTVFTLYGMQ